jgi:hypothetical protein
MAESMNRLQISERYRAYQIFERDRREASAEFIGLLVASHGRDRLYRDWRHHLHFTWEETSVEEGEFTTVIHCECWYCGTDLDDLRANADDWIAQVRDGQPPPLLLIGRPMK